MPTIFDSAGMSPLEHQDQLMRFHQESHIPATVTLERNCVVPRTRVGLETVGNAIFAHVESNSMNVTRTARQLSNCAVPDMICVNMMLRGTTIEVSDTQESRVRTQNTVFIGDQTVPNRIVFTEFGEIITIAMSYAELALPPDAIRRAIPLVHGSPMIGLIRSHLGHVWQVATAVEGQSASGSMLANGTAELVRALLASCGASDSIARAAAHDVLGTRILNYTRQHLGDVGLTAEDVAAVHNISLRHLYNLWPIQGITFMQWVIDQRLESARKDLARLPANSPTTIAAVARRWGFKDSTHFSRRFRDKYGLTPNDWRHHNQTAMAYETSIDTE